MYLYVCIIILIFLFESKYALLECMFFCTYAHLHNVSTYITWVDFVFMYAYIHA